MKHTSDSTNENAGRMFDIVDSMAPRVMELVIAMVGMAPGAMDFEPEILVATLLGNIHAANKSAAKDGGFCLDCVEAAFEFGVNAKNEEMERKAVPAMKN